MKRELGYGVEDLTETRPWERFELVGPEEQRRTWEIASLALCALGVGVCLLLGGCKGSEKGQAIPDVAGPCPPAPELAMSAVRLVDGSNLYILRRVR
jgi:hypothetical protein